jgi:hypothetical protein
MRGRVKVKGRKDDGWRLMADGGRFVVEPSKCVECGRGLRARGGLCALPINQTWLEGAGSSGVLGQLSLGTATEECATLLSTVSSVRLCLPVVVLQQSLPDGAR